MALAPVKPALINNFVDPLFAVLYVPTFTAPYATELMVKATVSPLKTEPIKLPVVILAPNVAVVPAVKFAVVSAS